MSYCLNPNCTNPENPALTQICQACGWKLLLRDRYRISHTLGQGGFGATFLAKDESLPGEPWCVIKQLRPTTNAPHILEMARELFQREAKILGKLGNHPNLPRLLDYFEFNKEFYLVQEYVGGSTLQQEVKQKGAFSESGAKQFLCEILPILQFIHSQRVIHRDIKPANIIRRTHDRQLVLIDFGAVKDQVSQQAMSGNASDQTALTNFAIGTPGFAPPEQLALRPVYASDLYALGVTCIYLLTAKSPKDLDYNPSTGEMMWQNHVHVTDHFMTVLTKMLEVSVKHRYQSSGELLRDLEMEPYLDSLKGNLLAGSQGGDETAGQLPDMSAGPNTSGRSYASQSVSDLAQAIRDRKAKAAKGKQPANNTAGFLAGIPRSSGTRGRRPSGGNSAGKRRSQRDNTQSSGRWTAASVQESYSKGRRDFASQNLSMLNLQRINLSNGRFHDAKLTRTNLHGANLFQANFCRATLNKATLRDANLSRAYFNEADLQEADLRGADLSSADFSKAKLNGTNLCGANLSGAVLSEDQLAGAKTNWMTVLPNGKRGFL